MNAPLQGLRVVDFTRVLAGPHCTKILRDLGADVTKIEPPAGDAGRGGVPHINSMSVYYTQQNAGKRNLSIDLNYPEAREIVRELCRDADVVVENLAVDRDFFVFFEQLYFVQRVARIQQVPPDIVGARGRGTV